VYVYRNCNNGNVIELKKPRRSFDDSPNWELISGQASASSGAAAAGTAEIDAQIEGLSNDGVCRVALLAIAEMKARGLDDDDIEAVAEADPGLWEILTALDDEDLDLRENSDDNGQPSEPNEGDAHPQAEPETKADAEPGPERPAVTEEGQPDNAVPGQTELEATAAAVKLADAESIDLSTLTGTGDDGRIVLEDVRKAVEAKGGDAA
jgi:pyruvate/2-oxoglutarate dehydrogenase complex dihydrolipoamide acyltransferase (E2) component